MLAEQFLAAAAGARNSTALDETIRLTWRAHAEGKLADADAEAISEVVRARRATLAGDAVQWPPALGSNLSGLTGFDVKRTQEIATLDVPFGGKRSRA
jgi:hypothetical protein